MDAPLGPEEAWEQPSWVLSSVHHLACIFGTLDSKGAEPGSGTASHAQGQVRFKHHEFIEVASILS